ncbi:MAG: hypothetical protein GC158_06495 [Cyanobacteria bacterium RI_101]|nr:hypothetical protein [Cyanobacteria bacterium RI_101]
MTRRESWQVFLQWVGATTVSVTLARGGIGFLVSLLEKAVLYSVSGSPQGRILLVLFQSFQQGFLGAVILGAALGWGQWLVLRRRLSLSPRFILATALGLGFSGFLVNYQFFGFVGGLCLGLAQWFVLRRRLPWAGWWPGVNAIAWGLASAGLSWSFISVNPYEGLWRWIPDATLVLIALTTLGSALLTGGVLVLLLRQRSSGAGGTMNGT